MKTKMKNTLKIMLAALLVGAAGTALADTPCEGYISFGDGANLCYKIEGTTVLFCSPDPDANAVIPNSAFKAKRTITSFVIPDNVTQIGSQAFMGCTALTDIDLGNVQDISTKAFEGCTALTEVVIPPAVTNIGEHAFYGCTSLQTVLCRPQAPEQEDVPVLGTDAFTNCDSKLQICVTPTGYYKAAANWINYSDKITSCYLDENDEQTIASGKIITFRGASKTTIDIFRTLRKAGCFNTLTLPFNVPDIEDSPLHGAEVYTFTSATVENGTLLLDIAPLSGTALTAGTPYLIQWSNTGEVLNRMHFDGITWDSDENASQAGTGDVQYIGFYGKTHINDDENHSNLFLAGGNELYWPSDGGDANAKMLGFRAYFNVVSGGASNSPVRKGMPAALRIQSTPTGIDEVKSQNGTEPVECTKVLRDGQIIIIRNGEKYSINGQKL